MMAAAAAAAAVPLPPSLPPGITLGSRVEYDNHRAAVRYIGPVITSKSQETLYAGLEWDDATRGKNDGAVVSASGVETRYFCCDPGRGSFVKLELLNSGIDVMEALALKYEDASAVSSGTISTPSGKEVSVHLVGDDTVRSRQRVPKLTSASLRGMALSRIGELGGAAGCAKLRELDVSQTLLSSWEAVAELGRQLPNLRVLNIGDNRFSPLTPEAVAPLRSSLQHLRVLVLTGTPITWPEIECLHELAPNLEELHLCRCGITSIVPSPARWDDAKKAVEMPATRSDAFVQQSLFKSLRILNLSGNSLASWGDVFALSRLPKLESLLLSDNGLTEVWVDTPFPDSSSSSSGSVTAPFPALEQLTLSGNPLCALWAIDALDAFAALTTLRISNTDVPTASGRVRGSTTPAAAQKPDATLGPSEARQLLVARLPRLLQLNGSEVRLKERQDAEKAYTRRIGSDFAHARGFPTGPTAIFGTKPLSRPFVSRTPSNSTSGGAAEGEAALQQQQPQPQSGREVLPLAFRKAGDGGVIRARTAEEGRVPASVFPLFLLSSGAVTEYVRSLDPFGLGSSAPVEAALIQSLNPRYFELAARYDLHAVAAADSVSAGTTLAGGVVGLCLRSMAGDSCTSDPVTRKLPVSMTVGALKQMLARMFKCDPPRQQLSLRESTSAYSAPMDDDMKPLSYYAVTEGSEVTMQEVDPAQAARAALEAEQQRQKLMNEQQAAGDMLRNAQNSDRRFVGVGAASGV